jgi:hypothetical protein
MRSKNATGFGVENSKNGRRDLLHPILCTLCPCTLCRLIGIARGFAGRGVLVVLLDFV